MRKKNTLTSADWDTKCTVRLHAYLVKQDDGSKTGADVKAAVPELGLFESALLNSKIKQIRKKISDYDDYNPVVEDAPLLAFMAAASKKRDAGDKSDDEVDPSNLGSSSTARPTKVAKQPSPVKTTVADVSLYSKSTIRAAPFQSTLRLHEICRYQDPATGFYYVTVFLRLVADQTFSYHVTQDGKQLLYTIKPVTNNPIDFIDPKKKDVATNPATVGTMQYFGGDPGTESFVYTMNFPEPVHSSALEESYVYRTLQVRDITGAKVTIKQPVCKTCVFMVAGQRNAGQETAWGEMV